MGRTLNQLIKDFERFYKALEANAEQPLRQIAKAIELEIKDRVLNYNVGATGGLGVDDTPIRDNVEQTIRRKERKGRIYRGRVKSLWDTGRMLGTVWQKRYSKSERAIRMGLPDDRRQIAFWLADKGYDNWWGIPTKISGVRFERFAQNVVGAWVAGIWRRVFK